MSDTTELPAQTDWKDMLANSDLQNQYTKAEPANPIDVAVTGADTDLSSLLRTRDLLYSQVGDTMRKIADIEAAIRARTVQTLALNIARGTE